MAKQLNYKKLVGFTPDVVFSTLESTEVLDTAEFINGLAAACRALNDRWWRNPRTGRLKKRNDLEMLFLAVGEITEGGEGIRKDKMDDHLPHRKNVEVEIADCIIRLLDYAAGRKLDVGGALVEKSQYNWTRADHSNKARLAKGGKKF